MKGSLIYLVCVLICTTFSLHPYWRLAWSDEFDTLDITKWNVRSRSGNYGNGELQWYHPNQVNVSNGNLVIKAIKQAFGGETYMSGWLDTQDKAYFTYGRYEIRAQMAPGKGMWPAMWLLSQTKCWASGAEVDIAEFRGSYPTSIGMFYHAASKCCTGFSGCISSKGSGHTVSADLTAGYHVYALEWYPSNMTWYLDDAVIDSYQTSSLVNPQDLSPHYWIINSAVGGGYPGNPDSTTVFPNYHYVDYVRNYVWRSSCSGTNVCSGNGCCDPTSFLCLCNSGWSGASCEQWVGSVLNDFNELTSLDNIPNGWGNTDTLYLTAQTVVSNGALKFTLTNSGCPANCGNLQYASGSWEAIPRYTYGTFSFLARGPKTAGTGYSLGAAGASASLEQIAFSLLGASRTTVDLRSWTNNWGYLHSTINLGFDHSAAYHNYSFTYAPAYMIFYVDGTQVYNATVVVPKGLLGMGAYYTADNAWYGTFNYPGTTSAYLTRVAWQITQSVVASCAV